MVEGACGPASVQPGVAPVSSAAATVSAPCPSATRSAHASCAGGAPPCPVGSRRQPAQGCVPVPGIHSTCENAVKRHGKIQILEGDCFFVVMPTPSTTDYSVEVDARLAEGGGYGLWLRGTYTDGYVLALGVQYDAGAEGLKYMHYPETNGSIRFQKYPCDQEWHHWKLVGQAGTTTIVLDGKQQLEFAGGGVSGAQYGFRTWGGRLEVRNLVMTPL